MLTIGPGGPQAQRLREPVLRRASSALGGRPSHESSGTALRPVARQPTAAGVRGRRPSRAGRCRHETRSIQRRSCVLAQHLPKCCDERCKLSHHDSLHVFCFREPGRRPPRPGPQGWEGRVWSGSGSADGWRDCVKGVGVVVRCGGGGGQQPLHRVEAAHGPCELGFEMQPVPLGGELA